MLYEIISGSVCAAKGFKASGVHCGLRRNKSKLDLGLVYAEDICKAAGIYTENKIKGASVTTTKRHLENGEAQAIIINSGNANTCNLDGEEKATLMCELVAKELSLNPQDVIVASTGIIGKSLPIEPIESSLPELVSKLSYDGYENVGKAILTTDSCEKNFTISFNLGDKKCVIGGIAKGSGMIHPNMATMLCFLTTDVNISKELLSMSLRNIADDTFNMISVDGDTSTNDMATILASGKAGNEEITDVNSLEYQIFSSLLYVVMENLAKQIAQDGEGATKLMECQVTNADSIKTAKIISKSVITSNLFKCAIYGEDPNWGRILCAIGYAPTDFDVNKVSVSLKSEHGEVKICSEGRGIEFDVPAVENILTSAHVFVLVDLDSGEFNATAWGCDLTYDYVKINAAYQNAVIKTKKPHSIIVPN